MNYRRFSRLSICILVAGVVFSGCARAIQNYFYKNLKPEVQTYVDPDANFDTLRRFSIVPSSTLSVNSGLNTIAEKQIMFLMRSAIEARGYTFVTSPDSADFVVAIDASTEYRERYVPPTIMSIPTYTPPQSVTVHTTERGTFDGRIGSSNTFGDYRGKATTTVTLPGHTEQMITSTGGYSVGDYVPTMKVFIYDASTRQNIWYSVGRTQSLSADVRLGTQPIALAQARSLPPCKQQHAPQDVGGISFAIKTEDGNSYSPIVTAIDYSSPAGNSELREDDTIVRIDGIETRNKPYSEVRRLLTPVAGQGRKLAVQRYADGDTFEVTLHY